MARRQRRWSPAGSPACHRQARASQKPQFFVSKSEMSEMPLPAPSLVKRDPRLQGLEPAVCALEVACGSRASSGF